MGDCSSSEGNIWLGEGGGHGKFYEIHPNLVLWTVLDGGHQLMSQGLQLVHTQPRDYILT